MCVYECTHTYALLITFMAVFNYLYLAFAHLLTKRILNLGFFT